ncbi:MmgE/PrpD family protein [Actinomadura syzygii]|uniref:MmgE/PrpD family protein n=1 Tax=Actinomadura syzygii TaxID=1427538 RepID=UPI001652A1EE|nr:MmgE/PrpD family protein [Actinomadura syzygii]
MDKTTERLVDFALDSARTELPAAVRESATAHLVDAVAVAIAGTAAEPARLAADLAVRSAASPGATVIGRRRGVAPEAAAFANAVMVRTYDWNDGMQAKAGGHPSDMIPGLFATAEVTRSSGADLLTAITLAYEILGGLGAATDRANFDQGLFMGAATALGCGVLLGLDRERMGEAASLALTTALPLGVHRWGGALAMTKGGSTAFAVKNGVFCAQLAQAGFTSAPEPFEGYYGLFHVTGEFEPRLPVSPGGPSVMEMAHQKPYPAESQCLGLLDLAPRIREWAPVEEIESIELTMADHALRHVCDPAKYDPRTRETADHSLPYMLAVALVDGGITLDSYRPERVLDPALRPIMRRIRATSSPEFDAIRARLDGVTRAHPIRAVFRTTDGRERVEDVRYHRGHFRDPMTRDDVDDKFDRATRGVVGAARRAELRADWWGIAEAADAGEVIGRLADLGPSTSEDEENR